MPAQQAVKQSDATHSHMGAESVGVQAGDAEPAGKTFALVTALSHFIHAIDMSCRICTKTQ